MTRKNLARSSAAGVISISALLLAACGGGGGGTAEGETPEVTMGVSAWIGYGMWHIAEDQEFDEANNVDLEVKNFDKGADRNAALLSGELQAASMGAHYALMLAEQGAPITVVMAQDVSLAADGIVARGDVKSVEDLKGKQVAYEEGQTPDIMIHTALADHGMTIDDIEKIPMSASEAGAGFVSERVDVAVTYEPYLSEAKNAGGTVIYDAGEHPGLISDVLVIRNDYLESDPEAVTSLIKTFQSSYDYYGSNEEEGRQIIAEAVGSDVESLSSAFDGLEYWDIAKNKEEMSGPYVEETLPVMIKSAVDAGILESDPQDLNALFDTSFIEQA